MSLSLMKIAGNDWKNILKIAEENTLCETELYKKGTDDSFMIFGIVNGIVKKPLDEELLDKARDIAEKTYNTHLMVSKMLNQKSSTSDAIGAAYLQLTFGKYIEEQYISKNKKKALLNTK